MDLYADKEYVCTEIPHGMRVAMFAEATDFIILRGGRATWLDIRLAWDKDVRVSEVMRNRLGLVDRDREVHGTNKENTT